ncbi:MAG TPA: hypothetical protein PKZ36_02045 [Candidatus Paceibacterota bacterium]|nr:hypothetical protein [Candidatus Paceibacterota bacterium]HPT18169.1 hypothetical protein [Candidatus Paceibacterota bacterium]
MGIFSSSKNKDELALVFDIGSSSIGGALFLIQKNGVPKIIYSIREPITLEKTISFDRFLSLTLKSLEAVATKIGKTGLGAPKETFCVLSSPWYASQTRSILLKKDTPFIFNSKLADSLIQKEILSFEADCKEKYTSNGEKVVPIELKNMQILLNGYPTQKPLDQKASELEMTVFVSMGTESVLEKIKEVIGKHFYHKNIKFSSFIMSSFAVARDIFVHQDNFLLIDIGGEVTDISMIKKDILRSSVSFPFGKNFLIRGVASILDCSLDEAISYISLYKDGHIADSSLKKIEPIINKLKNEWLTKFQESLVKLSNDISIPSTIFLTVTPELANFFTETIKSEQFNQYTLTESKFKVVFLGSQALHGVALIKDDIVHDSFLIIESIYISRFLHK